MKIATFNINNVRKRLPNLLNWLETSQPDVACLQELKTDDSAFPAAALLEVGYRAVWCGERTWNGVAILARGAQPVLTRTALPGDESDKQARYIEAAVSGVLIASIYAPNGNPQPGPKLSYKLAWLERLEAHAASVVGADAPVVLAGDYNVVPTDADIYSTRSWSKDALLHPKARGAFARLLAGGWNDALRTQHPDKAPYTFWSYFRDRWPRDAGLRIDHLLLNPIAAKRLDAAGVDRDVRGEPEASDHAPAWIELKSDKRRPGTRRVGYTLSESDGPKNRSVRIRRQPKKLDGSNFARQHCSPKLERSSLNEPEIPAGRGHSRGHRH